MNDKHDEDLIKTKIQSGGSLNLSNAETLGHYKILRKLGQGGMGEVHLGYEESLRRYVAIKILPQFLRQDPELVERFFREAQAVAKLKHPGIVGIYYFGEDKGKYFFAMEYVEGINLEDYVETRKTPVIQDILKIVRQSAEALKYASDQGVIHRDIKPSNILIDKDGNTHIADFGLAKQANLNTTLTATGSVIGSPFYMSPEQAKGEPVDFRADIYSLGCTFYFLLEGNPPFDANAITQVMLKHINEPLPELSKFKNILDGKLSAVLQKMTQKNPNHRYTSYNELLEDLQDMENAFTHGARVVNPLPLVVQKPKLLMVKPGKKSKVPGMIGKLLIVVLVLAGLYYAWNQYQQGNISLPVLKSALSTDSTHTLAAIPSKDTATTRTQTSSLNNQQPPPPPPDAPEGNSREGRVYTVADIKQYIHNAETQVPELQGYIKTYDFPGAGRYIRTLHMNQDSRMPNWVPMNVGTLLYHLSEAKRTMITAMNGQITANAVLGGQAYMVTGASELEIQGKDTNQQIAKISWKKVTPEEYYGLMTTYISHSQENDAVKIVFLAMYQLELDKELKTFEQTYGKSFDAYRFSLPQPPRGENPPPQDRP